MQKLFSVMFTLYNKNKKLTENIILLGLYRSLSDDDNECGSVHDYKRNYKIQSINHIGGFGSLNDQHSEFLIIK
jgi:hypothetical protein